VRVGIPSEVKPDEYRVALTPAGVRELVDAGHEVVIERGAGLGSAIDDDAYVAQGATIVPDADAVFEQATLIVKVKEPQPDEVTRLEPRHTLFTYLHLAADPLLTKGLMASGATCIAYETVEDDRGRLPLLAPMSEVAGKIATQAGAFMLEKPLGGRGVLLGGVPGVAAANVHALAIDGTFDDCQDLVKAMFADAKFRGELSLSAVNSINWARIMAQTVYYVAAALALGVPQRAVAFAVPTGNFGNVFAAHVARRMGLPVAQLVIGSNRNDILARFINGGTMSIGAVEPSLSPSMDIQVASNFERFYFELKGGDAAAVAAGMAAFRRTGTLPLTRAEWERAAALFSAARVDDDATLAEIKRSYESTGAILDPHSAVAVAAARACRRDKALPMVALATAHPAKFPDAVARAIGKRPPVPPRLAQALAAPERKVALPRDLAAVQNYVRRHARAAFAGAAP